MNKQYTTQDIIKLYKQPQYKPGHFPYVDYKEFQALNTLPIAHIFDEMTAKLGKMPTQKDYIVECIQAARPFFDERADTAISIGRNKKHQFGAWKENELLIKALKGRSASTYLSKSVEYTALIQLQSLLKNPAHAAIFGPEDYVISHEYLDLIQGVDMALVLKKQNIVIYFHVIKNSKNAEMYREIKWNRGGYYHQNKYLPYDRKVHLEKTIDSHIDLKFDTNKKNSVTTDLINGMPLLKEEYLLQVIKQAIDNKDKLKLDTAATDTNLELNQLHNWLPETSINKRGLETIFI